MKFNRRYIFFCAKVLNFAYYKQVVNKGSKKKRRCFIIKH